MTTRILFFLGSPNPSPDAAWTRIGFFANNWSKKECSVEVLGTFSYSSFKKRGVKTFGNVNLFNLIFNMQIATSSIFTLNSAISFLVSTFLLLARKPNITIVSVPSGDAGLGAMLACRLVRARYLVDYRDEWEDYLTSIANSRVEKFFFSVMKKLLTYDYARSQLVTTVTPNFVDSLKRRGVANVRLIPNGADIKVFKPVGIKRGGFTIIYSGGIGHYYRLDVAVKAIARLVNKEFKNIQFVIAGGGAVQKISNLALGMGISSYIDFEGAINDKAKLARLISESNVGLIPYDDNPLWRNSLPAKFFEYCACGIPVIATAYEDSLIASLIKGCEIGLTVPPMDEQKLAEAINRLYKNQSFRAAAGKRARILIEEKFDRNKIAAEFLNLVRKFTR